MACLDENQLVAFFAKDRAPSIAAEVEAHCAECKACRNLLVQYAEMSEDRGTSQTRRDEEPNGVSAATPSLTPGLGARIDAVAPAVRLAQARVSKHIGTTLKGKWQIERLLGFGGMAYVFAARHRNGRRVAIKCMRPELLLEASLVERFLREGYVANKIEHPGAVAILDDDVMDDGAPFLVMELLEGKTLRERLVDGTLPLDDALKATADVLDVLAAAHDKGIIHRDLKPENLFQTNDGAIKVLDFGIARLRERARSEHETQLGTTMGTVGFMPPEQARGLTEEIDARSDVWAIGATLYTLLTGKILHKAPTQNEALLLAMTTPVAPMAELVPWLPVPVRTVLDRALSFEKNDRYPNARAMKDVVDAARSDLRGTVMMPSPSLRDEAIAPTEIAASQPTPSIIARVFSRRGRTESSASLVSQKSLRTVIAMASVLALIAGAVGVLALRKSLARTEEITALPPSASIAAPSFAASSVPPSEAVVEPPAAHIETASTSSKKVAEPAPQRPASPPAIGTATGRSGRAPTAPVDSTTKPRQPTPPPSSAIASPPAGGSGSLDTRDPLGVRH